MSVNGVTIERLALRGHAVLQVLDIAPDERRIELFRRGDVLAVVPGQKELEAVAYQRALSLDQSLA